MPKTDKIKTDSTKSDEKIEDTSDESGRKTLLASLTEKEIADLANDMYRGMIFTDRHVQRPEDVPSVFMPLIFMRKEFIEKLKANPPGMIYEYFSEAGPRSINGMPIFWSFRMINIEDTKKVIERYNKIKHAVEDLDKPI